MIKKNIRCQMRLLTIQCTIKRSKARQTRLLVIQSRLIAVLSKIINRNGTLFATNNGKKSPLPLTILILGLDAK